ncbi:MAG: hypothetical protein EBR82_58070 [Caulobacteraceae bacterium]|nr:hypothetical protein [Caulobacteraceae bacterium]
MGDKLATNATQLGEMVKGVATTLTSPVELFNAIAFGDPNNQLSKWASSLRSDVTAAQAAVDPEWQKTKTYLNEQLTKIGADRGQIDQAIATIDMYANNPRAIGDLIAGTVPSIIPGLGAYTALRTVGAGAGAAYAGGAFTAATTSQTDLVAMADKTYENILKQVQAENPSLTESEAQVKAAAGAAISMRGAGLITLAGSTALQLLPGSQLNNILLKTVTKELGQEIGDEIWVKALSNAWQGKPLQDDMGRTTIEAVVASGPIAGAAQLLSTQMGKTYNKDEVIRDLTWEVVEGKPTFDQNVKLLTGPDNQLILNSANQPILLTYSDKPALTFTLDPKVNNTIPFDVNQSAPAESIFDIIFDNEKNGGYTVNAVNLDGNEYTVTDGTGKVQVIDTNDLFNNALNLVTQTDPAAIQTLKESNPLVGYLTEQVAKNVNINAVNGALQTGSVISSNDKGAFAITNDGAIAFIPKTNTSGANGVAMSDFQGGDSVVIGNGYAAPAMKQVDADGNVQVKVDELKVDPLSGFGRVIGLDNSQALVALPNQELLTINRANLSPDITVGATVPYNQSTVTQRGVTTDYAQSTFGLTQTQLLQGLTIPSVSQLPVFVNVVDPSGANKIIDAAKPNIGSGTVISVDPNTGTALVSAGAGNPQVVNLQGMNPNIGTDIFFNPGTSAVIGTPVITKPETQTKPSGIVSLIPPVYTPIGLQPPSITTPPVELTPPVVSPPVITTITPPAEIEVPTITPPVVTPPPITIPPVELTPPVVTPPGVTTPPIVSPPPVVTPPVVTPPVVTTPPIVSPPIIPPSIGEPPPFGYPSVPPPELSGTYELPYPNYLRPLEPYLGYGIGALMGDLYDEKQGYGGYQPSQNAGSQIKIPT